MSREIRKMFEGISVTPLLTKLRAGDIKTIALCSITVLCIGLSYLLLEGTPAAEEKKVEEEKKEEIEFKDYTIEQLVREAS